MDKNIRQALKYVGSAQLEEYLDKDELLALIQSASEAIFRLTDPGPQVHVMENAVSICAMWGAKIHIRCREGWTLCGKWIDRPSTCSNPPDCTVCIGHYHASTHSPLVDYTPP